jgi:hypothetical protein
MTDDTSANKVDVENWRRGYDGPKRHTWGSPGQLPIAQRASGDKPSTWTNLCPLSRDGRVHSPQLRAPTAEYLTGFVRRLRRYYAGVRLLWIVHQRLRLLTFPLRTIRPTGPMVDPEISRFLHTERPAPHPMTTLKPSPRLAGQ